MTYISLVFGYVRLYKHGENASIIYVCVFVCVYVCGDMMKYLHILG